MTEKPEIDKQALLDFANNIPFLQLIGLEVIDMEPGWSKTSVEYREDLCQPAGILHGGVMATLVDTGIAHALMLTDVFHDSIAKGGALVSVDLRIRYFRSVSTGTIYCESRIPRMGRQIFHGESVVTNAEGKEVARGDSIYMAVAAAKLEK